MSLQNLREALLKEAEQEAQALLQTAERDARKAVEEEQRRALDRKKESEVRLASALAAYRQERWAWAHLEKQRRLAEAKEDAIRVGRDELYELLKKQRGPLYVAYVNQTTKRGLREVGTPAVVHLAKRDAAKQTLADAKVSVKTDLTDSIGGIIVENANETIRFNGTLEARLEEIQEMLRKNIHDRLFRGEERARKTAKR